MHAEGAVKSSILAVFAVHIDADAVYGTRWQANLHFDCSRFLQAQE